MFVTFFYQYGYLTALLLGWAGVSAIDRRYKLAFYSNFYRSLVVILMTASFFILTDIIGIGLDLFHTNSRFVSGIFIGSRDLPLEEFLLLGLVGYITLMIFRRNND